MNAIKVALSEIDKIIKSRFIRLAVIVVAFMPLLYSFLYLYAFWDPYSKLDKLPVAIVNQDTGGIYDDKNENIGKQIIDKLKEGREFDYKFVNYQEGINGLKGNKYYFMINIPQNFTKDIISIDSKNPKKAVIEYITNDKKNFLATQIGNKAIESIQAEIQSSIRKNYIDSIFKNVDELGEGLKEAANAGEKLSSGALELSDGALKLNKNMIKAMNGSIQLKDGALKLNNGLSEALKGMDTLSNGTDNLAQKLLNGENSGLIEGMNSLKVGINGISQGIKTTSDSTIKLKNGIKSLTNGYDILGQNVQNFSKNVEDLGNSIGKISIGLSSGEESLKSYISKHPEAANDPDLQKALMIISNSNNNIDTISKELSASMPKIQEFNTANSQLNQVSKSLDAGIDSLNNGILNIYEVSNKLDEGANKLYNGLVQYNSGINIVTNKILQLSQGLNQLDNGLKSLNEGSYNLYSGIDTLSSGIKQLQDGTEKLQNGTRALSDKQALLSQKLSEASDKILSQEASPDKKAIINNPVSIKKEEFNPVKNYGIGFAPYFIPLSLWVGALILFFLIDIFDKNKYENISNKSIQAGKFLSLSIVGILQSVVSSFVLVEGLKLSVHNLMYYYLINAVMSIAFVAIIQLFVMLFGIAGKFFAIVLLMLQLTSSGGTFPMQLLPKFFNAISPYLPMTYGVAGLREVISGNNINIILQNIFIIGGFGIVFLIFTMILAEQADKMEITQRLKKM